MPNILPFPLENVVDDHKNGDGSCALKKLVSKELFERAQAAPHLMDYLHMVPMATVGAPEYYPQPTRKLGELEHPNLIYLVSDDVFVHIYPDIEDPRNYYLSIEPSTVLPIVQLMREVDRRLLDYVDLLAKAETTEEKTEALIKAVESCCVVKGDPKRNEDNGKKNGFPFMGAKDGRIAVTQRELETVKYLVLRDKIGLGVLEPLIRDPHIEDISCAGLGPIFIEHKIFKGLKSSMVFKEHEELDDFALKLSESVKKPATFKNPIVDAALPDGSRLNIVYGGEVSKRGTNFTIRKFSETPISVLELINFGSMDFKMAAYLAMVVGDGLNLWVSGETASGKTTLLNAITTFIRPDAKIVSIEDTPELQVPHINWVREVVRSSNDRNNQGATVDMFGLLKAALRQRPNAILVGEIRGEEGSVAFQAKQTGHQVMSTFHASTVEKLIQRVTGSPISVPKTYIDNLNVVVICSAVRLPNGKLGRRVVSINEIIGYDNSSDSFSFVEVFRWNPAEDAFEFLGNMNSYLLENRIAPRHGLTTKDKRKIYTELDKKAAILEKLQQQNCTNFYDLYQLLAKAQRENLF
jgi:flagellar protein FlaI